MFRVLGLVFRAQKKDALNFELSFLFVDFVLGVGDRGWVSERGGWGGGPRKARVRGIADSMARTWTPENFLCPHMVFPFFRLNILCIYAYYVTKSSCGRFSA